MGFPEIRGIGRDMKKFTNELRGLVKSFQFALRGFRFCILNERNMRIHIVVLAMVLYFSMLFGLAEEEWILLIIVSSLVLVCEMINTAIEALVNLGTSSYDNVARVAKDVAAGAVFLTAFMAVIVGGILFIKPDKLYALICLIVNQPFLIIPFVLLLIVGPLFVIFGSRLKRQ